MLGANSHQTTPKGAILLAHNCYLTRTPKMRSTLHSQTFCMPEWKQRGSTRFPKKRKNKQKIQSQISPEEWRTKHESTIIKKNQTSHAFKTHTIILFAG